MNNLILVHGLRSKAAVLLGLQRHIESAIPPTRLAVECYGSPGSYLWKNSVLTNGAELASHANSKYPASPIFIVGHSMGGLIARMANLFLWSPARMEQVLINKAPCYGFTKADIAAAQGIAQQLAHVPRQRRPEVKGLVTLATPNSGAMRKAQTGWLAMLLRIGLNSRWESVQDLTSDRLFRLFQHFRVPTDAISVSGSANNAFTSSSFPGVLGARLTAPNDLIVEDSSVDLGKSVLPHEFVARGSYRHHRAYRNCIDVKHTNIYDQEAVKAIVMNFLKVRL